MFLVLSLIFAGLGGGVAIIGLPYALDLGWFSILWIFLIVLSLCFSAFFLWVHEEGLS